MKKLLYLLLLVPFFVSAQVSTGMEQDFDYGLRNLAPQTVLSPTYLCTQGIDGTIGRVPIEYVGNDTRTPIADANHTITGAFNQIIAFTSITADRTVTLPAANNANQRIWITDESGLCSNARRIIVMPNGSDVIGGDSFSVINFPNGSGYLESDGAGKWNIISTTAIQFSAGVNTAPTVTDNLDGSITVGSGVYALFANVNGVGRPKAYLVAGNTFTLVNQSSNFIYAEYNTTTGVVSLQQTTNETPLNDLTQILVYSAYRDGTTLHPRNFDSWGIALANKLNRSIYRTQRVRVEEGGILLGESASPAARTVTISAGTIWVGANEQTMTALTSAANTCYHVIQTSPGVWTNSTVITQYNNTQYNTTAGLQTLNNNEYGVNWVYRSIGTDNDMAIVLGSSSYTLGAAQTSAKPTNLPTFLRHMELVGRIIVQKNAATATQIDNVSSSQFTAAGVTDHNALLNLQGGAANDYYHLTAAQLADAMFYSNSGVNTTLKTYNNNTLGLRNIANTFTSFIQNSNTASRTYTLQDKNYTFADDATVVHTSGNESVTGVKTFTSTVTGTASASTCFSAFPGNGAGTCFSANTGTGTAIGLSINCNTTNAGVSVNNNFSGTAVLVNNAVGATGKPFRYTKNTVERAFIDDTGNISGQSIIAAAGTVRLFGYTVATLPAGTIGDTAYVTDATTPTAGGVAVGGGALKRPVFFDGTNWITYY